MAEMTTETEEEEDFGDFTEVEKPSMNGNHEQGQGEPSEDDMFGDFASTPDDNPQKATETATDADETPKEEEAETNGDDDFGDVGSSPASEEEPTNDAINQNTDTDISPNADHSTDPENELTDAAAASPLVKTATPDSSEYESAAEAEHDEFGDFGGADTANSAANEEQTHSEAKPAEESDENISAEDDAIAAAQPETPPGDDANDDFGGSNGVADPDDKSSTIDNEATDEAGVNGPSTETDNGDSPSEKKMADEETTAGLEDAVAQTPAPATSPDDDDDFGDFDGHAAEIDGGGAPTKSTPTDTAPTNGGEDVASQTPVPAMEPDDTDVFGGFADAAAATGSGDAPIDRKPGENSGGDLTEPASAADDAAGTPTDDNNFGGFEDAVEEPDNGTPPADGELADDSFGDFNAPASTADDVAAPVPAGPPSDGDKFGGFADAKSGSDSGHEAIESKPTEDSFGDFNEPTPAAGDVAAAPAGGTSADDSFGDFNAPASTADDVAAPVPAGPPADGDKFGGFADAKSGSDSGHEAIESKPTEDSFGDFNETAPAAGDIAAPLAPTTTPDDDDDFGDFGGFSAATDDTTPVVDSKPTEDSFGDFNEPSAPKPADPAANTTDDDFGDFGGFNDASAGTENVAAPIDSKPTDESFGDFNEPSDPQIQSKPTEESFGDFNEPSSQPAPPAAPTTTPDDDDFGDFGDFDSAPASAANPPPQKGQGGGFESFSEAKSATTLPAQQHAQPKPVAEESDPVLQKAKTVFSKVFESFNRDYSREETSASCETIAVADLTASMNSDYDSKKSDSLLRSFQSMMEQMTKEESPPVFIVSETGGYSPNAHFSVPVDGEPFGTGVRTQQPKTILLPQLAQPLPQGGGTSQNQPSTSNPPQSAPTGTTVQLPPPGGSTSLAKPEIVGEQLSDKAKRLLQKIPDLSFMLQPKLCLPGNAK